MKKQIDHVAEFHDVFQIGNESSPKVDVGSEVYMLRYNLMREENDEYLDACRQGDLVEVADALGDQLYILCGTILKHGLQHKIEEVFDEIQRSNMSKLDLKILYLFKFLNLFFFIKIDIFLVNFDENSNFLSL